MKKFIIVAILLPLLIYAISLNNRRGHDSYGNEISDKDRKASYLLCDSAEKLKRIEKYSEAESILRQAIKINPYCAPAYNDIGGIKWMTNFPFDTVVYYYEIAKKFNPLNITAYANLSNYYLTIKHFKEAISEIDRAIPIVYIHTREDTFRMADAYCTSADAKNGLGRTRDAIADANKALQLNPQNDNAYSNLGISYKDLGNYEKGIECQTIALQLAPKHDAGRKYIFRALCYNKLGKYQLELKDYDSALLYDDAKSIAYFNRGLWYIDMKMKDQALVDLKIADSLGAPNAKKYIEHLEKKD